MMVRPPGFEPGLEAFCGFHGRLLYTSALPAS